MSECEPNETLLNRLQSLASHIDQSVSYTISGTITRISGMKLEATGIAVPIGTNCRILVSPDVTVNAEVVGFADDITYLMATESMQGIKKGTPVVPVLNPQLACVGMKLLGRVIDADGKPIDNLGPLQTDEYYSLLAKSLNPLERKRVSAPLDVGIRVINALMTVGKGQRVGIFAGSGVGKSVLLGMMTKFTKADVVVVGLIGERSREVKEFIEENLGTEGLAKAVVVAAPADRSPLTRINGATLATTLAEYYRDKGLDVLLIVDSLTRFAQAQREVALSVGEMPATKGFTPSVFAKLAQLVERSGNGVAGQGSITALYTVLVEGDDLSDPIADHVRSLLDGHITLSRQLAESGHYPAVDVEKSISRTMPAVVSDPQLKLAMRFKKIYSAYALNRDLINIGMYQFGADASIDESIKYKDRMHDFLVQDVNEAADMQMSLQRLQDLFAT